MLTLLDSHELDPNESGVILADSFRKEGLYAVSEGGGILKIMDYVFVLDNKCSSFMIVEAMKCIVPLKYGFDTARNFILHFMIRNTAVSVRVASEDAVLALGLEPHLRGYDYIVTAVCMAVNDPALKGRVMTKIYPVIAEKFGTSGKCIERNIRYVIDTAYENRKECLYSTFPHEKPSPAKIIWHTANEIRKKYSVLPEKTEVRI